jgi:hypothetical protein
MEKVSSLPKWSFRSPKASVWRSFKGVWMSLVSMALLKWNDENHSDFEKTHYSSIPFFQYSSCFFISSISSGSGMNGKFRIGPEGLSFP